jgi:glucose/arabinose dehydrogenase
VPGARELAVAERGVVFVGSARQRSVYALVDGDGDGRAERVLIVARDLEAPNGVAYRAGSLYVAEVDRVLRYDQILDHLEAPPPPRTIFHGLPKDTHHGYRYLAFSPKGELFTAVGAPCNVCDRGAPYGTVLRLKDSEAEIYAEGVRNSVGLAFDPMSQDLWFTDNGRDHLGDDLPSCELNHAPKPGLHFGFPFVHGRDTLDPQYGKGLKDLRRFTPPALELGAHVAPLGLAFYTGEQFPPAMKGQLFIAEHGSWNRSRKVGYRVVVVRFDAARQAVGFEPFAEGWLQGEEATGRPVDVKVAVDGTLLVSDDEAGAVYRIAYAPAPAPGGTPASPPETSPANTPGQ